MQSRAVFEKWLAWAAKQMEDADALDAATINVIGNTAAKYGLGTTSENTHTVETVEVLAVRPRSA